MTIPEQAVEAAIKNERDIIAGKAREWAANYSAGSDGQNTFVLLAEWIEARETAAPPSHMGVQRPDRADVARALNEHWRKNGFDLADDDLWTGFADAVLALPHTGQPQEGDHERDRQVVKPIGQERS